MSRGRVIVLDGMTREQRRAEIDRCIVLTLAELVLAGKVAVIR